MSRIGANAFDAFPPRCHALDSQFIAMPARYEFADPLTLHFRPPDAQVPPQWPLPVLYGNVLV
jgi:hypothetical protein